MPRERRSDGWLGGFVPFDQPKPEVRETTTPSAPATAEAPQPVPDLPKERPPGWQSEADE